MSKNNLYLYQDEYVSYKTSQTILLKLKHEISIIYNELCNTNVPNEMGIIILDKPNINLYMKHKRDSLYNIHNKKTILYNEISNTIVPNEISNTIVPNEMGIIILDIPNLNL